MKTWYTLSILLLASLTIPASNAAVLSYNGYTLDESTHIVSKGSQEWLQWTQTTGLSIIEAVKLYGKDGWEVANNEQLSVLFNDWNACSFLFDDDPLTTQGCATPLSSGDDISIELDLQFVRLFGSTVNFIDDINSPDRRDHSWAWFDEDLSTPNLISFAQLYDDFQTDSGIVSGGGAAITELLQINGNASSNDVGVALVRKVPEPSTLVFFALGAIALHMRRSKR